MTPDPPLTDPFSRHAYALETHRQALELYDYIFPPWRWREWRRRAKEVRRRTALLRAAMP